METLKNDFTNLIQKILTMDQAEVADYMTILQSQPTPESEDEVESQQDQIEGNQNSSNSDIDTGSDILPLELNIHQLELNLEIFCRIFLVLALIRRTCIMKILF